MPKIAWLWLHPPQDPPPATRAYAYGDYGVRLLKIHSGIHVTLVFSILRRQKTNCRRLGGNILLNHFKILK